MLENSLNNWIVSFAIKQLHYPQSLPRFASKQFDQYWTSGRFAIYVHFGKYPEESIKSKK